ncbi:MAG: histidine kinase [Bacteroidales bacterium]|nr:histidine kinase [Bacteroidales bacterium]
MATATVSAVRPRTAGQKARLIIIGGHGDQDSISFSIDPKTGKVKQYHHDASDSSSIAEDNILSTYVDSKGRIWIGTVNKGVNILNPLDGTMEFLSQSPQSRVRLNDNKIWTIYEDRGGNFWLGTNRGINKISPEFDSVEVFCHDPLKGNSISNDWVFSIYQDAEGIFWIGTMGGGLNRFDPLSGVFKTYNESNGLPNNVVYATLEDGEGNLWISTNWGLSKFNKQSETFVNYDSKDGVQGNEFNIGASFKNASGEMYFGGMGGFNVFHPSEITVNKVPPRMVFTGFRILNAIQDSDLENGEVFRLKYNENYFSFEFSALDYTNPSKNLYRYKLLNYDDEWVFANASQRRAEYRKVGPGSYRFVVTGSNNDGVWNDTGISLNIIIRPPWWKTWIFRLAFVLLLIFILWSIILVRIRTIRKKHDLDKKMLSIEKQVFELEQKALRLQMNPHFMFNSLNAIQNFVLANDTDKAVNYLAKFSHLMRMILANSTASLITLKDELKALTYYIDLEKLRFDDKFEYVIVRDPSIDEEFVEIPPMLFQPYVENAIIHGLVNSSKPGLLEIVIRQINRGTLLCTIKDNGIGREKAIEIKNASGIKRQPKGMMITQERIEIFNKQNKKNFSVKITDLKDEQGKPTGTMVEFTIQFKEI